jgi:hypothetical protein
VSTSAGGATAEQQVPRYPNISHLHTYFFFPFSIDKDAVRKDHAEIWRRHPLWIDGLDAWIAAHGGADPVSSKLGRWKRASYSDFGIESPAYQDMVFFHPFVRRVFFDTTGMADPKEEAESLLRFYTLDVPDGKRVLLQADDSRGRKISAEITAFRLMMFANGIGILSISVECHDIPGAQALWINEMMRKVYPSSGRQLREGRMPRRQALILEDADICTKLIEECWEHPAIANYQPPLSKVIKGLLYFTNYERQEYEPVLDERMIVYTYLAIDPRSVPEDYAESPEYQVFLSRVLYVDRAGDTYRYDRRFLAEEMRKYVYRRWAHQGTYYGFSAYSNITLCIGSFDCDDHLLREGFLIHRMFRSRYYLMAVIALFYRATLLDMNERTALISKRLFRDFHDDREFRQENIDAANGMFVEFLHFANFWHFDELANKDEEQEHFEMQCSAFRIQPSLTEVEQSVRRLNSSLNEYYESRQMAAVNRLAVLSLVFGCGAVLTGFFGMNFGGIFRGLFFENHTWAQAAAVGFVALATLLAFAYGGYLIAANWQDYRDAANPRRRRGPLDSVSVKRID